MFFRISYSKARSIKTRIETIFPKVRVHKLKDSKARSIKTRIETALRQKYKKEGSSIFESKIH